jgi:hypothetical protein
VTTPTPAGSVAGNATLPPGGNSSAASSSGAGSPVATFALEILGVVVLAILAGIGPRVGKVVALFTLGILILWLVLNATTLKKLIPGTNVAVQG